MATMKQILLCALSFLACLSGCAPADAPARTGSQLPPGFKGYELYSWQDGGQWHFTLTHGTNRVKTRDEIVSSGEDSSSGDTMSANIHVTGVQAIVAVLARLPRGEQVFWMGMPPDGRDPFPPRSTIDFIARKAAEMGLDLSGPSTP
jgi:hypothetical protein